MTNFFMLMWIVIVAAGVVGHHLASFDLVHNTLSERKLAHRLSEMLMSIMVVVVVWITSPHIIVALVPPILFSVFVLLYWVFGKIRKEIQNKRTDLLETALRTTVCTSMVETIGLGGCLIVAFVFERTNRLSVSYLEECICHGLLLGSCTLLFSSLCGYLYFIYKYADDSQNVDRALTKFRKLIKNPPKL